jgi:hypothetical protein
MPDSQLWESRPPTGKARTFFRIVAYASFAMIVVVLGYAVYSLLTQGIGVIGSNLVDLEFPPPSISPVYAKPITILYAASLAFMYAELELIRGRAGRVSFGALRVFKFLAFFAASIAFFELAYNLIFWSAELAAQAVLGHLNPDTIANPFPDLKHPINVVFASKTAAAVLIAGVYVFYYISRIQDAVGSNSPASA